MYTNKIKYTWIFVGFCCVSFGFWTVSADTSTDAACESDFIACERTIRETMSFSEICQALEAQLACEANVTSRCPQVSLSLYEQGRFGHGVLSTAHQVAFWGCTFADYTPSEQECSLKRMIQCYNPVYAALSSEGLSEVTDQTSLAEFIDEMAEVIETVESGSTSLLLRRNQMCSNLDVREFAEMNKCFRREREKCDDVLRADVTIRQTRLVDVLNNIDYASTNVEGFCEIGCDDVLSNVLAAYACIQSPLHDTLPGVKDKYNAGRNADSQCRAVKQTVQCTARDLQGCDPVVAYNLYALATPGDYQMYAFCDVTPQVDYSPDSSSCSTKARRDFELFQSKKCYDLGNYNSDQELCYALQRQTVCMTSQITCCKLKCTELTPMLHNWAMFNHLSDCHIKLDDVEIRPKDRSCDYSKTVDCLTELFDILDFQFGTSGEIHAEDLISLHTKLDAWKQDNATFCTTATSLNICDMRACIRDVFSECGMLPTCNFENADCSHRSMNVKTLLVDLDDLEFLTTSCHEDCDTELQMSSLRQCDMSHKPFLFHINQLKFQQVNNLSHQTTCSDLTRLNACYKSAIGGCQYLKHKIQEELSLCSSTVRRLADLCDVDFIDISRQKTCQYDGSRCKNNQQTSATSTIRVSIPTLYFLLFSLSWLRILL